VELQFITHFTDTYSYYDSARMALEGGCRWIQLRMKDTPVDEVEREAIRLQGLCKDYGATFIIDDHVELVKKIHADGVHLGKKDMPVAEARGILGKEFIIGGTANTFDDVKMHYKAGADYIGCGPFRFTTTKKDLSPVLGLEGYRSIILQMKEADIHAHRRHRGNYFGRYPFHHGNGNHRHCFERNHTPGERPGSGN
jgi:thiE: thiamine-phosphate pyrophosphorylase